MNKSISIAFCLLGLLMSPLSFAKSKQPHKPTYYQLFDDGGEHPVDTCELVSELPGKLKKTLKPSQGYLGTKQIEFADQNEAGIDAYQHYFATEHACKQALKELGY